MTKFLARIAILSATGALWGTIFAGIAAPRYIELFALGGAGTILAVIGAPWALAYAWCERRPRGRHSAPIVRSRSRYVKVAVR